MSATVFKFCIHNEDNQVFYCKQNQGAEIYFCIFLFFFLAHLSRRLTGELIGYPWIRPSSVRSHFQTSSPFKPLGQSKPNIMWSFLGKGGKKVCINGPGHMTKMAAMPIYGKNLKKIFFSRTRSRMILKLGM